MVLDGAITLININDGKNGEDGRDGLVSDKNTIVFNKERVNKYQEKQDGQYNTVFSPSSLIFYIQEKLGENSYKKLTYNDYNFSLSYSELNTQGLPVQVELTKANKLLAFSPFMYYGDFNSFQQEDTPNNWTFKIQYFWLAYQYLLQTGESNFPIRIKFAIPKNDNVLSFSDLTVVEWEDIGLSQQIYVGIFVPSQKNEIISDNGFKWTYLKVKEDFLDPSTEIIQQIISLMNTIGPILQRENSTLYFDIYDSTNAQIGRTSLPIGWATSEALMKFAVNASNITAAIDSTKLTFSADGITLKNGGIEVIKETVSENDGLLVTNKEKSLYFDELDGNLYISGNITATDGLFKGRLETEEGYFGGELKAASGTFAGELKAATGSFSGHIDAQSGSFRGSIIADEGQLNKVFIGDQDGAHISILAGEGIIHYTDANEINSGFAIKTNGKIIANDISLNKGQIGSISLDGSNSIITGQNWFIGPDEAQFNNITASGKITTAIFEQQNTQVCGSTFLYKNGYSLNNCVFNNDYEKGYEFTGLNFNFGDSINNLQKDYFYMFTNNNRTNSFYAFYDGNNFSAQSKILKGQYDLLIELGLATKTNNILVPPKDWIIGINSSASDLSSSGLSSNSITLSAIEDVNGSFISVPKIILGQLPYGLIEGNNEQTYGLYAESAFLTGTLTTQYTSGSNLGYAGINTLNGAIYIKNFDSENIDNSKIILWAGSSGTSNEDIQQAKFQVTENGTLYATQGYFEGSILTKATIEASVLKTTTIIGTGSEPALKIRDAEQGIEFQHIDRILQEDGSFSEEINSVFSLSSTQLGLSVPIIFNNDNYNIIDAKISSPQIAFTNDTSGALLNALSFEFFPNNNNLKDLLEQDHGDFYLEINNTGFSFYSYNSLLQTNKSNKIINFNSESTNIYGFTNIEKGLNLGDIDQDNPAAQYQTVYLNNEPIGIDLYIGG